MRGSLKVSLRREHRLSAAPLFDWDGQLSASGRWECYSSPRTAPVLGRQGLLDSLLCPSAFCKALRVQDKKTAESSALPPVRRDRELSLPGEELKGFLLRASGKHERTQYILGVQVESRKGDSG